MEDDPYRSSQQVGTCPRCGNTTENDGERSRLVCLQGCGEWYPRAAFERGWSLITMATSAARPQPWPWTPASCPVCKSEMKVGYQQELRYDYCDAHGVWLDTGEYERFATLFGRS